MPRGIARLLRLLPALQLVGCAALAPAPPVLLSGETMGSTWTVKIVGALPESEAALRDGIQAQFDAVNLALSTWRPDSALSRFNADDTGEWRRVDPELARVMHHALGWSAHSGGAYDITIGPLVDLWGFGPDPATHRVPETSAIVRARSRVDWRKVEVDVEQYRARKPPGMHIDLSSLGKGRGVDRVATWLESRGVSNYLIDLSGKLRASGHGATGRPWQVAVERPGPDGGSGTPELSAPVVSLREESIATAGDYRRFFESGGRHYSHIIDPRTGEPVAHHTVSATVVDADCMRADAVATVLMVMPPRDALALAERLRLRALIIERDAGRFELRASSAWRAAYGDLQGGDL